MFSVFPLSGFQYSTVFTASDSVSSESFNIAWGDGTFSNTSTAIHTYSGSNIYSLTVGNCISTSAFSLSVYKGSFFDNKINITYNALSAHASCPNTLTINISSILPYSTIFLYSSGSNSIPYQTDRNFWSHLNPEWKFSDSNNNPISEISLTGTPVYNNSNQLLGYSANSNINYVDDMPGNPNLFFTMMLNSCNNPLNSRVYAGLSYSVSALPPTELLITADGINNINALQWADSNIPYLVSVYSSSGCSNIMHYASGYLTQVTPCQECFGVNINLYQQYLSSINSFDSDCFPIGGYSQNYFNLPSSALIPNNIITNFDPTNCNTVDINNVEYSVQRNAPTNVTLTATGIFNVNGTTYTLTGASTPFNVYKLENIHDFYRKGEDKTVYDILYKYSHFDLDTLPAFNAYLSAVAGPGDTLGIVYDKIYNLHKDIADIDICTIDSVQNIAQQMDVVIDDYALEYPEELKRIMNFVSVPLQKLIGTRCVCNTNFINCAGCNGKNICSICNFDKRSNVGNQLMMTNYVSAGITILKKDKSSDIYEFLPIYEQNGLTNYKLNILTGIDLNQYCFFEWDKTEQNNPVSGIIDYKNQNTIIDRNLSSNEDWYSDNGVIEEIINYVLTRNIIDN